MLSCHMRKHMCQKKGREQQLISFGSLRTSLITPQIFINSALYVSNTIYVGRGIHTNQAAQPKPDKLLDHLQMDFSDFTLSEVSK